MAANTRSGPERESGAEHGLRRPGRSLLWTEPARSAAELGSVGALLPRLRRAPRGDGHHVVVFPGLMASDNSTRVLRWYLRDLGYQSHGWELGVNIGPTDRILDGIVQRVRSLYAIDNAPVSLVGWSLGGVFAREIARILPSCVRCVITLGSPFAMTHREQSNARAAYNMVSTFHSSRVDAIRRPENERPRITVPTTAIYSKQDGIVPWRACVDEPGARAENIRVVGSHTGLGHNPQVLLIIADRLAQPVGGWTPYAARHRHAT